MKLGTFSISLAVKDIKVSKEFYVKIGFQKIGGDQSQGWLILKNGDHTIGLFQGMFEDNILTFNPGWDKDCNKLAQFTDVRDLYKKFKSEGIEISSEPIDNDKGPASFSITDPDGNSIMIDQHV